MEQVSHLPWGSTEFPQLCDTKGMMTVREKTGAFVGPQNLEHCPASVRTGVPIVVLQNESDWEP